MFTVMFKARSTAGTFVSGNKGLKVTPIWGYEARTITSTAVYCNGFTESNSERKKNKEPRTHTQPQIFLFFFSFGFRLKQVISVSFLWMEVTKCLSCCMAVLPAANRTHPPLPLSPQPPTSFSPLSCWYKTLHLVLKVSFTGLVSTSTRWLHAKTAACAHVVLRVVVVEGGHSSLYVWRQHASTQQFKKITLSPTGKGISGTGPQRNSTFFFSF